MTSPIALFALALIAVTALALALLINLVKRRTVLFIAVPITLALAASAYFTIDSIMARPLRELPAGEFVFFDYVTDGKIIFIWIYDKDRGHPVTVQRPYNRPLHQQLELAKQGKGKGKQMIGKKQAEANKGENPDSSESEIILYEFSAKSGNRMKDEGKE